MEKIGPYELNTIVQGDCLELMKEIPDNSVDCVVTDPPYGANKAEWDNKFPTEWYKIVKNKAGIVATITGSCGLIDSIKLVGCDFIDVIAGHNLNGMTRGPIGFGNWLACVISNKKPRQGVNAFSFTVSGMNVNHPSPKPLNYMLKLIDRLTDSEDIILDPFAGSGTTLVAAKQLGRKFLGFELEEKYCEIARQRLAQEELF